MPSKLPKLYGHYRLISLINSGGMGDIFLAKDTQLQRSVAIKLLRSNNPHNPSIRPALENSIEEGRILAKLSHPNIVQVFDVVDSEDDAGFVMEYIDGQNLADLPKHKLSFDDKLAMLTQIAEGLAAAHKQDIIHCDIKPANIIIG
ncbi:MAG: serine/threonine-protein kinase, partial [Pseudomonadota bacterium]